MSNEKTAIVTRASGALVGSGLGCPNYECGAHLSGGSQSLGQPGQPQ
jgi:hypothetical protein